MIGPFLSQKARVIEYARHCLGKSKWTSLELKMLILALEKG